MFPFIRNGAAAFLFAGFAAALTAGCRPESRAEITLRVAGWGDVEETRILQQVVEEFRRVHPGVDVQLLRIPFQEYITKILTQFSAGLAPDVMAVNAEQIAAFAQREVFLDLKPYAKKDPDLRLEEFYPEAVERYTVKGKLIAIPRDIAPICVVYYNKKAFDEVGLSYPNDSWDITSFLAAAKKLVKKNTAGRTVRWGFVDDWAIWENWVYVHGGRVVDSVSNPTRVVLDSPAAVAGVQFRADLIHKHGVLPGPAALTAMGGLGNADLFLNGSVAMFHSGIWKTPAFRNITTFEWDVVQFPKGPGGERGHMMSAAGYGIVKSTKHPDVAYALVRYLSGEVGQKLMATTGLTQPAIRRLADSAVFLDGAPPLSKRFLVDAVRHGVYQPLDPQASEWMQRIDSALDRVWLGEETAGEALKRVVPEVNRKFFGK